MKAGVASLILFGIVAGAMLVFFFVQRIKKQTQLTLNARFTRGEVTKITPVFKGSCKIDYSYSYKNKEFSGFTLANEKVGYSTRLFYLIKFDPALPSNSQILPKICGIAEIPLLGWAKPPTNN